MTRNFLHVAMFVVVPFAIHFSASPLVAYQSELPSLEQAVEESKMTGKPILAMAGRDT